MYALANVAKSAPAAQNGLNLIGRWLNKSAARGNKVMTGSFWKSVSNLSQSGCRPPSRPPHRLNSVRSAGPHEKKSRVAFAGHDQRVVRAESPPLMQKSAKDQLKR
jgi:hypothetical protein